MIDTRRYRWMIGGLGFALVIAFSVYLFASRGVSAPGVAPGKRLHRFVAPLATATVDKPANTNPGCDPAHPNPLGLNVCGRTPLVLALFVTGSGECEREVDTLQRVSGEFAGSGIVFAAVAIDASRSRTRALVDSHRWTIQVGFDPDGRLGQLYGVSICPIVEIARRGGIVVARLIGNHWLRDAALAARVRAALMSPRARG